MSRSGYSDDYDEWELIMYRGAVNAAIKGKRGQRLLRDMAAALDAMPVKELIAGELERDGQVCALGALARARGIDVAGLDPEDASTVAAGFDIANSLAREMAFVNDDDFSGDNETSTHRWQRVRAWVQRHIRVADGGPA